jgi:hypothetical protein
MGVEEMREEDHAVEKAYDWLEGLFRTPRIRERNSGWTRARRWLEIWGRLDTGVAKGSLSKFKELAGRMNLKFGDGVHRPAAVACSPLFETTHNFANYCIQLQNQKKNVTVNIPIILLLSSNEHELYMFNSITFKGRKIHACLRRAWGLTTIIIIFNSR